MAKAQATKSKGKKTAATKAATKRKCGKCKKTKDKCQCGRPLFSGKKEADVIAKLEEAFIWNASDEQACINADISVDALYRYERKNPEFRKRKAVLKQAHRLRAKKTVYTAIETDAAMAFRLLERTEKSEYAPHSTFSGELAAPVEQDEDEDALAEAVNQWMTKPDDVVVDETL